MSDTTAHLQILLAEYDALKREQGNRIDRRDQLMYATLTAVAGVLAAVFTHTGPPGLLLLPPVCLILGWTYLRNDRHVAHIKEYLRDDLGPRLGKFAGAPVLQWEDGRRQRRPAQVGVEFVAFAVPAMAAVLGYIILTQGHGLRLLVVVGAVEFTMTFLLALETIWPGIGSKSKGNGVDGEVVVRLW